MKLINLAINHNSENYGKPNTKQRKTAAINRIKLLAMRSKHEKTGKN